MSTSVLNRINSFFVSINMCCRIRDSDGSKNKVNLFNTMFIFAFSPWTWGSWIKPNYLTMWQLFLYNDQPNVGIMVQFVCYVTEQPCPRSFVFHFLSHYCCQPPSQRVSFRKSEKPWGLAGTVANLCPRPHAAVHILSELSTCIPVSWSIAFTWSSSLSEPGSANCRWPEVVASRGRLGWKLKEKFHKNPFSRSFSLSQQ